MNVTERAFLFDFYHTGMVLMANEYYDLEKTAEVLKLSTGEVNRLRERGEIRAFRDGSNWKFKRDDVEKFLTESIKNRSKNVPPPEDNDLLSIDGGDDEDLPTLLADSASFDALTPQSFVLKDEEDGVLLADDDISAAEDELGLSPAALKNSDSDDDIYGLKLADEDDGEEDDGLQLDDSSPHESDILLAGESGIDLAGDSGLALDDDDLVLGGSGSGSDINIGGDSGLSLLDTAEDSGFGLASINDGGSDAVLELAMDDDILALSDDADHDTATLLNAASESDFQLVPDNSGNAEDSESSSQVIAIDNDDSMFMSELDGTGLDFNEDDPFGTVSSMPDEDLPPAPSTPVEEFPGAVEPASMFGDVPTSPFDSPQDFVNPMADTAQPGTPLPISNEASAGPVYSGLGIVGLVACLIPVSLAVIIGIDMISSIWSWDEPYMINSAIMDFVVGTLGL